MEGSGGILRSACATHNELVEPGARVVLTRERTLRQEHKKNLCGCSDLVAIADVTAIHPAKRIRNRHMQMCPCRAETARNAQDFQRAGKRALRGLASVAKSGLDQTANASNHER